MGFEHDDPTLRTGEGGLTVWKLQEMVQAGQLDELDALFRNGLTMNRLPSGYAAGAAARVLDVDTKAFGRSWTVLLGRTGVARSSLRPRTPRSPREVDPEIRTAC